MSNAEVDHDVSCDLAKKVDTYLAQCEKAFQYEEERRADVAKKSEMFIGAIAVIIGFKLVDMDQLVVLGNWKEILYSLLACTLFVALFGSLLLCIAVWRVTTYSSYPDAKEMREAFGNKKISGDQARIMVANSYLDMFEKNRNVNNRMGHTLRFAGYGIIIGVILFVAAHFARQTMLAGSGAVQKSNQAVEVKK